MFERESESDETAHLLEADDERDKIALSSMSPTYPKSVFFIVSNEFCERFSYYGMRTVLSLYLTSALKFDENSATVLYHVFAMLCYFFPLCGAIIADSFLGKFKTILYLSIVYALGNVILSVAAVPTIQLPHEGISVLGLLFIAIGTGGIKPCVSSFGGDQFVLPEQALQLQRFFSVFYFSINAGSLISTFMTPMLRNDVKCFGQESCFPLAFGVPAVLMVVSVVVFILGKSLYKMKQPEENIIVVFINCIWRALANKTKRRNEAKDHWLEYADDKYSKQQIRDIRAVLNVLYLFMPVPFFWALYDQQGSRWTFQATSMDGRVFGYTIKPDQMQVVNPLLILAFIPVFEVFIYPAMKTVGIKRPLQKLVIGGFLAAVAFVCSALLEWRVEESYGVPSVPGMGQLRIFNSLNCNVSVNPPIEGVSHIPSMSDIELLHIPVQHSKVYQTTFSVDKSCSSAQSYTTEISVNEEKIVSYFVSRKAKALTVQLKKDEKLIKNGNGDAQIRFFYSSDGTEQVNVELADSSNKRIELSQKISANAVTNFILINAGTYKLVADGKETGDALVLDPGEIDTVLLHRNAANTIQSQLINMVPSNKVHILWQLPQYIIITAGEVMFSITGLEFSFTQAPPSMKSVLSAAWLLTVAFGNLIVVVISEIKFFDSQAYEFLLFAVLMALDVLWLIVLCVRYKYVSYDDGSDSKDLSASEPTDLSTLST